MKLTRNEGLLPDGWQEERLGDVAKFVNGRAFRPEEWGTDGLPIIRIQNLTLPEAPFNFFNGDVSDKHFIENGDIVVSWSASLETWTWQRGPAVLNQHIFKVIDNPSIAGRRFLFHLLQITMSALRQRVHGTTMQHVTKGNFDSTLVLVPPLREQRAIAVVLDSLDEAIERTEVVISATERLRDALLHELLTRGVPGWHTEWKDVPGIGTIPADWKVARLGDICHPPEYGAVASARPYDPRLPRYVRITDLTDDGRLKPDDARSAEPSQVQGYELRPGDLLFARSGATVGKTYMYRQDDGPCVYAGYLIRFAPIPELALPHFLELTTHSHYYLRWVASMNRAGAQPNINAKEYASLRIPLPPTCEQRSIAATLNGLDEAIERAHEDQECLQSLKASVAEALLTGQVRTIPPQQGK